MYHKNTFTYQKYKYKKNAIIVYAQTALHFATFLRNPICYDLSFVFPANLIWLLHASRLVLVICFKS
jgi:hypothetical protein